MIEHKLVGSRSKGTHKETSDWDFELPGVEYDAPLITEGICKGLIDFCTVPQEIWERVLGWKKQLKKLHPAAKKVDLFIWARLPEGSSIDGKYAIIMIDNEYPEFHNGKSINGFDICPIRAPYRTFCIATGETKEACRKEASTNYSNY